MTAMRAGARPRTYAGLFLVTCATLMCQILLTRIFSVTMWYHFAFAAISIAMFGMTVGALIVYLRPSYFAQARAERNLALSAVLFSVSIVLCFLVHLAVPFFPGVSLIGVASVVVTYAALSVPFVFSGICVCAALTTYPNQVGSLYAADLAGAAAGCILLNYTLGIVDGPTDVVVVAFLAGCAASLFAVGAPLRRLGRIALALTLLWAGMAGVNSVLVSRHSPLLRLIWVKGGRENFTLYEKWNPFSRIRVFGDPNALTAPFGWGLSPLYPSGQRPVGQLGLTIDANAFSVLTAFHGDMAGIEHLKYDVTNLVHYVRPGSRALVVGAGGGRDILSALAFGQKSVIGVEMNRDILDAVNNRYGDFTGHLDRRPHVTFVADEARSYIARMKDTSDIIQISLTDTWAATAAGAYVLAENSLYTVEAWETFLGRLSPHGVLTCSRWYFMGVPGEMYRLTSLAAESLKHLGVEDPRGHIIIVRYMRPGPEEETPDGIGTMLVSREPFSAGDVDKIEKVADRMGFDVVLSPRASLNDVFTAIASGKNGEELTARFPVNIAPPTDDSPFFFHMLRLRDVFRRGMEEQGANTFNIRAVAVLGSLLLAMTVFTILCIVVPLFLTRMRAVPAGSLPLFFFFGAIGFGFMLVEISQMQRLIIFLGHPTYGLSVVLFALLVSGGLGSVLTQRFLVRNTARTAVISLFFLMCVLIISGFLTPPVIRMFRTSVTEVRILAAVATLFPIGMCMGTAFPFGMKAAALRAAPLTPWLWGINGAASVFGPVLAVAVALSYGISTSYWTGCACYGVAFLSYLRIRTS